MWDRKRRRGGKREGDEEVDEEKEVEEGEEEVKGGRWRMKGREVKRE